MKTFSARETVWLQELDGIELAGFRRRAFAFAIDSILVGILFSIIFGIGGLAYLGVMRLLGRPASAFHFTTKTAHVAINPGDPATPVHKGITYHVGLPEEAVVPGTEHGRSRLYEELVTVVSDVLIPVGYFGFFLWRGNGRTPGKRLMKIRVVSLVHTHMTFWHSVERALGYGAAALEGGLGFAQYFFHPYRRCAQDRLAETIVVTERSYRSMFPTGPTAPEEPTAF